MQHLKNILILHFLLLGSLALHAQTIKISESGPPAPKVPYSLSAELRQRLIAGAELKLAAYAEAATLLDKSKNRVTGESIARFKSLFNAAAELPKDYLEFVPDRPASLNEYCNDVFQRLEVRGVQMRINAARLVSIIDDPSGFYVVVVQVDKSVFNYLSESGGEKISPGGQHFKQEIHFDILKEDLDFVKIANIRGEFRPVAAEYARYFGPGIGFSLPFAQPVFSSYWTDRPDAASSSLSIGGGLSFAVSFDLVTNRLLPRAAPNKNVFASAGLQAGLLSLRTKLEDFSNREFDAQAVSGEHSLNYRRSVAALQAKERISIAYLSLPVGLALRVKESKKFDVFLAARLWPIFALSSSGNLSGTGTYTASIPGANWNSGRSNSVNPAHLNDPNKFGPFQIGDRRLEGTPNPDIKPFSLAVQLSPFTYIHLSDLNPNWSLLLGLDLTYHLSSPMGHDGTAGDILRYPDDYDTSILQHYTTGMSLFSLGFRVGLHHRLVTKP
jgi:hypothetical protein